MTNVHSLHVKYSVFLSDVNETWIFSTDLRKILKVPNFMKPHPVRVELFHEDGRTDGRTDKKLIVAFRNFDNALNNKHKEGISVTHAAGTGNLMCVPYDVPARTNYRLTGKICEAPHNGRKAGGGGGGR
jgi:hypothetical protein